MDIDKLEAGRELDALAAEYIFDLRVDVIKPDWYDREVMLFISHESGLVVYSYDSNGCNAMMYRNRLNEVDGVADPLPYFSEDIAAAWEVVERLLSDGLVFLLNFLDVPYEPIGWHGCFHGGWGNFKTDYHAFGCETAPLAICRAALKAVFGLKKLERESEVEEG